MHVAPVGDSPSLEQVAVAGQYDAALPAGDALNPGIVEGIVVPGVEPGHSQQAGQATQMDVGDKARDT